MDITTSMSSARSEHDLVSKHTHISHSISYPASSTSALSACHHGKDTSDKQPGTHLGSRFAKLKRRISRSLNKLSK